MIDRRFVDEARPRWRRLEELLERDGRRGGRGLTPEELAELPLLLRTVSGDLARLRAARASADLVRPVNDLVGRAHGLVYRRRRRRSFRLRRFFAVEWPRLFRRCWREMVISLALMLVPAAMARQVVADRPDLVADVLGGGDAEFRGTKEAGDIEDRFRAVAQPVLSSVVTTNNIRVALLAAALGISFGLGTCWVLIVNGTMLGGFSGAYAASGIEHVFWRTVLPHGALELSAIVVAGGAGLVIGRALWAPGRRRRSRALRESAADATRLVLGLVPAFVVAGLMEGFVTPSDAIPTTLKVALGVALGATFWAWLFLAGRREADEVVAAVRGGAAP